MLDWKSMHIKMANGHGGKREGAGRKPGSPTQRRREIIDEAAKDGITPLEVQLRTMRALWDVATNKAGAVIDFEKAVAACAIAKDAAPYLHPRLYYSAACLKIRTKAGNIEPLLFNRMQRYLHAKIEEHARRNGRVRVLILKAAPRMLTDLFGGDGEKPFARI
jgi:hypothetical protein